MTTQRKQPSKPSTPSSNQGKFQSGSERAREAGRKGGKKSR